MGWVRYWLGNDIVEKLADVQLLGIVTTGSHVDMAFTFVYVWTMNIDIQLFRYNS